MSYTRDTFGAVLSDFKTRLTQDELESFQFVTINDVRQTALHIQREQEQFKTMMNMARLESFLEAMDQFGKTIEIFVNASVFVAFVWGPMKFILQTASSWVDSFEVLVDAYSKIGEHMPLLEQYEFLFGSRPHMERILALIYADILEFHRKAIRFFSGKATVWQKIFRSTWKDFKPRFGHLLEGLNQHRDLIKEQAALFQYHQQQEDSQNLYFLLQNYMQDRSLKLGLFREQEDAQKDRKYSEILAWLSAVQSRQMDHDTFCAIRGNISESGHWILKAEKVHNWMGLDIPISSILWLNGIPGAGKTILASVIIDGCRRDTTSSTAYFYCKENVSQKNTCISVFRGILSQLLTQSRELIPYFHEKLQSSGEIHLTTQGLAELLLKLCCEKIKKKQFIIIDGLDECDFAQRKLLLSFFTTMVNACDEEHPGKLRVLFVSQHYPDIEKAFQSASTSVSIFELTEEDNKADITAYVQSWCTQIQKKFDLEVDKARDIQEATCMFLFAKLVMENLNAQESQAALLHEIKIYRFPKGLQEAYERIIYRLGRSLEEAQWITARKLLGWMVCAKRPLYWREIQAAVSMNTIDQSMDFEELRLRDNIRILCGSLVQVFPGDRVELVHTTAKMYITSSEHIHIWSVECTLAALCLRYLTFECFDDEIDIEDLQNLTIEGNLSFQDYATAKWFEHVRTIVNKALNSMPSDKKSQEALEDFGQALGDFVGRYKNDIQQDSVVATAKQDCKSFENYWFYDNFLVVWNHITCHDRKGSDTRNKVSIRALSSALDRNRKSLENISSRAPSLSVEEYEGIKEFYGESRFKCSKLRCYYFHEGFLDDAARKKHINRHDRPFECDFPDCSTVEFGFATNKDLEKHKRFCHPELEELSNAFTVTTRPTPLTPWECVHCHKRFTRGFHMRNHLRSHAGERPFACSECGKAFTRSNDCKRHEKNHR